MVAALPDTSKELTFDEAKHICITWVTLGTMIPFSR